MRDSERRRAYFSRRAAEYRRLAQERALERREVQASQREQLDDLQRRMQNLRETPPGEEPPF